MTDDPDFFAFEHDNELYGGTRVPVTSDPESAAAAGYVTDQWVTVQCLNCKTVGHMPIQAIPADLPPGFQAPAFDGTTHQALCGACAKKHAMIPVNRAQRRRKKR